MSNFPKPDELEELLELYLEKLELYSTKFNPFFQKTSIELKEKTRELKSKIEKYSSYSKDNQLEHLILSDHALKVIQSVHSEIGDLESKLFELDKMFRLGQNLL